MSKKPEIRIPAVLAGVLAAVVLPQLGHAAVHPGAAAFDRSLSTPPAEAAVCEAPARSPACQSTPTKVGEEILEVYETPHPYSGVRSEEPVLVWSEEIHYPGATYIAPHFSRFELAEGDLLTLRSPDRKRVWRYEGLGKADLGKTEGFWGVHIQGDRAVLELWSSKGAGAAFGVRIDRFVRGYRTDEMGQDPFESICGADDTEEAKCYQTSDPVIYDRARAVARLLISGAFLCTGWLVGNEGHVITNQHCIGSASDALNTDFEFMAEGADCATDCSSQLGCPGIIEADTSTLVRVNEPIDYALVLLPTNITPTYGFLQLRDTGPVAEERIYIPQHPAGWGKRIAVTSTHPENPSGFGEVDSLAEPGCAVGATAPEVGYYLDTQGGSSGSPVLATSDHRVVSLHHCRGSLACTSTGGDPNRGLAIQDVIADLGADLPPSAVCDPPLAATGLTAVPNGDNRVDLSWGAAVGATSYNVYRAVGACPQTAFELIATGVATTSYSDLTVSGGTTYAYAVTAVDDATSCESEKSACDDALATGLCIRAPSFDGVASATNDQTPACGVTVSWAAATGHCGSAVVYNVYRSTDPNFIPGAGNLVASCLSATTWADAGVDSGIPYYYAVRAEDDSGNGSGPCAGGNEDGNTEVTSTTPTGPDQVAFEDDMEAGTSGWTAAAGPNDGGGTTPWGQVTSDSNSPTHSWFVSDQAQVKDQVLLQDGAVAIGAGATLEFWHRYNSESTFDGGVLEYSTDGGTTWFDILAGNGGTVPANPGRFLANGYNAVLSTGFSNPLPGRNAWSGDSGVWQKVQVDLADLTGTSVHFRWRFGCDSSVSDEGWYVDDVRVFVPQACTGGLLFTDGFESGDTSAWSQTAP